MSLAESQILYSRGEYEKVLNNISDILNEKDSDNYNSNFYFEAKLLKADVLRYLERINECEIVLDEVIHECINSKNDVIKTQAYLRKCSMKYFLGDKISSFGYLSSAREIWSKISNKDEIINSHTVDGRIERYYGRYAEFYGNYEDAKVAYERSIEIFREYLDFQDLSLSLNAFATFKMDLGDIPAVEVLLDESHSLCEELDNQYLKIKVENLLGNMYQIKGEFEKSLDLYNKSLEFLEQNHLEIAKSYLYNYIGLVYQTKGDNEKSLEYHHKSLELSKVHNLPTNLVICYNNIGIIHLSLGELDKAWEYLMLSLQQGEGVASEPNNAGTHNNIGIIYTLKGELEMAFQQYMNHLKTSEKYQLKFDMATAYVNLGQIKQIQGSYEQAKDYFLKCLKIDEEIGNELDISETLYNIIILEVERGDMDSAKEYLEQITKLDPYSRYALVKLRKDIALAIFSKNGDRIVQKARAQEILTEISKQEVIDHELSVFVKFNLCELLFNELRLTGNPKVLGEIKELINDLMQIAEDQNSSKSLTEIYILQSKLALIEINIPKAFELLHQAEEIARSKGLTSLSRKISNQFDILLRQDELYSHENLSQIPLKERIDQTGLNELLSNLITKKVGEEDEHEEIPGFFLILSTGGVTVYQKNFESELKVKNELIGGLLSAIHNLSSDVFSAQSSTQRIRHNQFTVIIHPIDQLLFTYVFKGSSYHAMGKLEKLIQFIKASSLIWESLNRELPRLTQAEINGLNLLVSDILLTGNVKPTQD